MSTFDNLIDDVLQTLYGYGLAQPRAGFLTEDLAIDGLAVSVGSATGFEQGVAEIGDETVFIDSVDYANNVLTLTPDGRGYYGSTPSAHPTGTRITMSPTWPRARVARAINETILGTYPTLFGIGSTSFPFSPVVTTYELPDTVERVLRVTADTIGPSREAYQLSRWSFNSTASGDFDSGNTITLEKGAFPGRNINVTYKRSLSELAFGDPFTDCGLAESARLAIKYGACSNLIAFMDSSRLPIDTAQADELDPSRNGIGTASKLSAQLWQRHLVEVENERKRLRTAVPVSVSVRTR